MDHRPTIIDHPANGLAQRHDRSTQSASALTYSENRFAMLDPAGSGQECNVAGDHRFESSSDLSDHPGEDGYDATPRADALEGAMFFFQQTMRAFLATQQEVLNAYLVPQDRESGQWTGHAPSLVGHASGGQLIDESPQARPDFSATGQGIGPADEEPTSSAISGEFGDESDLRAFDQAASTGPLKSGPSPGPWVGNVRRLVPGAEIETVFDLDWRDDPIAEHHTLGGRKVSALDPSLRGLPVMPFAVMAEMAAQVAALVVSPDLVLTTLVHIRAHKWVRYEEVPSQLEIRGQRVGGNGDERVWVGIYNPGPAGENEPVKPVFEATAVFGESAPPSPPAAPWSLARPLVSRFTAESLYAEQWLFHGPPFQALVRVGHYSEQGMDGTLRVLPWEPLVRPGQPAVLHTDLIVIDSFTHLLGCWGLDYLRQGDVVFPLRLEALELYGERPPVGTDVECRIAVEEIQRHRVRVLVEIVRPDGTVWIRIRDWEDWRFHWPARFRDVFRAPDVIFVGEEIALVDPNLGPVSEAKCVWLEPPADMGRPVWRDVLEHTQLGPAERASYLASCGPDRRRGPRLWGRIAAKEAARRIWHDDGLLLTYPADLAIVKSQAGQPYLVRVEDREDRSLPAISIAHAEGVAVALAARDSSASVGIDVEPITNRPPGFEETAFTASERSLLDRFTATDRAEWVTRFWCAKQAAAKAAGVGLSAGPLSAEIVAVDQESAAMNVRLSPESLAACARRIANPLRIVSARRGNYAWAWTLGEGALTR
jgi:phosphopantetheinyl transferase